MKSVLFVLLATASSFAYAGSDHQCDEAAKTWVAGTPYKGMPCDRDTARIVEVVQALPDYWRIQVNIQCGNEFPTFEIRMKGPGCQPDLGD